MANDIAAWKKRLKEINEDDLALGGEMLDLVREFKGKLTSLPILKTEVGKDGKTVIVMPIPPAILTALAQFVRVGSDLRRRAVEAEIGPKASVAKNDPFATFESVLPEYEI